MNIRNILPLVTLSTSVSLQASCQPKSEYPNVIFILADDLGLVQTSAYGSGYYSTPNIDRLAGEGVRFTNAYSAAAISSPTRASIMTGKCPARLHITDFIPGSNRPDTPLKQPEWQMFLPLEETTVAEIFKERGYRTALFGKWHLSREKFGPESLPYYPDKQGFDDYFVIDKPGKNDDPESDPHKSDSIGNASVRFIRENATCPFFLFASFSAIHNPLMDSADSIAYWRNLPGSGEPENNPVIAAMLSRMDRNIGKILETLEELDLAKNTLVIFYSDNGGLAGDALQTPLRNGKGWLYEGGIRVPLVIRCPGVTGRGTVCNEPVSSYDFLPTFCDLVEVTQPENIDGVSLLSLLSEGTALLQRDLYWHYPHYHSVGMTPGGAIRSGKWKLVEYFEKSLTGQMDSAFELYDLDNDPGEKDNLAGSRQDIVLDMAAKLRHWRKQTGAQMPIKRYNNN
ncbi:sulfatase [Proteiniphilum sp.]|uniref:sulfatase n=1 Tax=Proteiniphilum sp. TaxID=1926877 RepID=UPI0033298E76